MSKKSTYAVIILILAATVWGFVWYAIDEEKVAENKAGTSIESADKNVAMEDVSDQQEMTYEDLSNEYYNSIPKESLGQYSIPELGVTFLLPKNISEDLTYVYNREYREGHAVDFVFFSTKQISALGDSCSAEHGPLGALARYSNKSTEDVIGTVVKRDENFYFIFSSSQAVCLMHGEGTNEDRNFLDSVIPPFAKIMSASDMWSEASDSIE